MTALALHSDLSILRGVDHDPTDTVSLLALEAASAAVRSYCKRDFGLVVDDQVDLSGTGRETLLLPEWPVLGVSDVVEIDDEGAEHDEPLELTDIRPTVSGILHRMDGDCWTRGVGNWRVTYTHGYVLPGEEAPEDLPTEPEALPDEIMSAVLAMAARAYTRQGSGVVRAETIGSYSVTYSETQDQGDVVGVERLVLDPYRSVRYR